MPPHFTSEAIERFWSLVDRSGECWNWTGRTFRGYGVFSANGTSYRAHRVAFLISADDLPDGLCVLHRCDNPSCCRPDHLFLGTYADNSHDMVAKGRHWMQQDPEKARKVTPAMIEEIRRMDAEQNAMPGTGVEMVWHGTQHEIAERLGISRETVNNIIHRRGRFKNT